jgi:hypothetical protein
MGRGTVVCSLEVVSFFVAIFRTRLAFLARNVPPDVIGCNRKGHLSVAW